MGVGDECPPPPPVPYPNPLPLLLSTFPLEAQRQLSNTVVNALRNCNDAAAMLPTERHVQWAMQGIAQAFAMPFQSTEDIDIASRALKIYEK